MYGIRTADFKGVLPTDDILFAVRYQPRIAIVRLATELGLHLPAFENAEWAKVALHD